MPRTDSASDHHARPEGAIDGLRQDVRFALRQIGRSPALSVVAVLVLAFGIGTSTLVFTVLDGVLLRPPPGVGQAEGLVELWSLPTGGQRASTALTHREFLAYRDQRSTFAEVAIYRPVQVPLRIGGARNTVRAELVSSAYFAVLDLRMELGTGFVVTDEAGAAPGPAHAVVGHAHWRTAFNGSPDIVGRTVEVNGLPYTVVGVAPERFYGAGGGDDPVTLWLPATHESLLFGATDDLPGDAGRTFAAVARLEAGVTPAQAEEVAGATWLRVARDNVELGPGDLRRVRVTPYRGIGSRLADQALVFVSLIGGAIGAIILLIACTNVSGLLLAGALRRRHEIGVRLALGAGRSRIVRQLLTESLLLAVVAGLVGVLVVFSTLDALERTLFTFPVDLEPRLSVLGLTLCVAAVTGLGFGLVPALHGTRASVFAAMKDEVGGGGPRGSRLRKGFTVAQLALSLPLLTAAGLLIGQLVDASAGDYGFEDPSSLVAVRIGYDQAGYSAAEVESVLGRIGQRVRALPRVSDAAFTGAAPLMTSASSLAFVRHPAWGDEREATRGRPVHLAGIDPEYFTTMGIPLLRGRGIGLSDGRATEAVAVVDEDIARRTWPSEDALGQTLVVEPIGSDEEVRLTVVGVAGRVQMWSGPSVRSPVIYRPRTQMPDQVSMTLVARTVGAAEEVAGEVRAQVLAVDRDLVIDLRTLGGRIRAGQTELSHASGGAAASGFIALLLACVGLYGMIAAGVSERRREIGVRLALGADRARVVLHFMREGLTLALLALGVGLPLAWLTMGVVGAGVIGVDAFAPEVALALAGVSVVLMAVALVSSWLPARRTSLVDPVRALRTD